MRPPTLFATVGFTTIAITGPAVGAAQAQVRPLQPPLIPAGTPIRLMVTKEVDSRTAKAGDRFKLRVDEAISINGSIVVPIGATAWGEVVAANGTGVAGGKGRLSARLLFVDLTSGRLPITGMLGEEGKANTAGVALSVFSFGLIGLLMKGGNAHLKAGDILVGYIENDSPARPIPLVIAHPGAQQ